MLHKLIANKQLNNLSETEKRLVLKTADNEALFQRPLPNNSFYKALSLRILRRKSVIK